MRSLSLLLSLSLLAACGGGTNPDGGTDMSVDGALPDGARPDGALPDGALPDGALPDGALPDGTLPDGALPDGALPDGALPDGALPDGALPDGALPDGALPDGALPDGGISDGAMPDLAGPACMPDCTTDAECGTGQRCLIGGSCPTTSHHCELAGRPCSGDSDCGTGEHCSPTGTVVNTCTTLDGSECVTSHSCPLGYQCEADSGGVRHCANRRHGCSLGRGGCPQGYFCLDPLLTGQFCVRSVEPCTVVMDCHYLREACADADGNGTTECVPTGACTTNADCPGATCDLPSTITTSCGPGGFCRTTADCTTGYHCIDVHEDGYLQCIPTTGDCQFDRDCTGPFQLCEDEGGHTTCAS